MVVVVGLARGFLRWWWEVEGMCRVSQGGLVSECWSGDVLWWLWFMCNYGLTEQRTASSMARLDRARLEMLY